MMYAGMNTIKRRCLSPLLTPHQPLPTHGLRDADLNVNQVIAMFAQRCARIAHLDGNEVEDGGDGALAARLAVLGERVQRLPRPEAHLDLDRILIKVLRLQQMNLPGHRPCPSHAFVASQL